MSLSDCVLGRTPAYTLALALSAVLFMPTANAGQVDIVGPASSGKFGKSVLTLPNGNIVVCDPEMWVPTGTLGAVYLYSRNGVLISTLTGSNSGDRVGSEGVISLANGNFVVSSSHWNNERGAVTWINGSTGLSGQVSAANSLVGEAFQDAVGIRGAVVVGGNNYVVASNWHNGRFLSVGAATWCNGVAGCTGVVSAANSLYGATSGDSVGSGGIVVLKNGNYVVQSDAWDDPNGAADAGAITLASGTSGRTGLVSPANSLIGSHTGDLVGAQVSALSNGNYVVAAPKWDNGAAMDAGAVTWGDGTSGVTGSISTANALLGSTTDDQVGYALTALSNGHYVVVSPYWDNGATPDVGAATLSAGSTGVVGTVSAANSLRGPGTGKGPVSATALSNGNYVISSPNWDAGAATGLGAVTWANGDTGLVGVVSAANSLTGSTQDDSVGGVVALNNGHYVIASPGWDGAQPNVGAVTWANGNTGLIGLVSATNSLIGTTTNDLVGMQIIALRNGNYVVGSNEWDGPGAIDAGAVTWADGSVGLVGSVSAANSLIGASAGDNAGSNQYRGLMALNNGNYVVRSPWFDNAGHTNVGAITWGNGATGTTGTLAVSNSLYGNTNDDQVGMTTPIFPTSDGSYIVTSAYWNGVAPDSGAITLASGNGPVAAPISPLNSVLGTSIGGGSYMVFAYNATNHQLVVGRPFDNIVSLFTLISDGIFSNGVEL